jgi:hypothetical protein
MPTGEGKNPVNSEEKVAIDKVKALTMQIHKLQDERKRVSPLSRYNNNMSGVVNKPYAPPKLSKRAFHHPHLDYVFAEVSNSPYLTNPLDNYSKETLYTSSKLRKLKVANKGKHLRDIHDVPCDMQKAEKTFIHDVIEFQPRFDVSDAASFFSFICTILPFLLCVYMPELE